ncbi:MAG: NAD(P)H-dependent oxidoreductase [Bdellovibrionota bacterium]
MNSTELIEKQNWRYAVKKFDPTKKISEKDWKALENALVLTPSSYGLQPWKFLIVQNPELRKQLRAVSWNQSQVEDCSHYVVMTAHEKVNPAWVQKFLKRIVEVRNVKLESLAGFEKSIMSDVINGPRSLVAAEWAARQCYIALGNLMTSAALLDIDTCPMEGLDPAQYDEILKLKGTGFRTFVACAVGYRAADDIFAGFKKVRFKNEDVVTYL